MTDPRPLTLLRYQDAEGRGPFRPGFSHQWIDVTGPEMPPPIQSELRDFQKIVMRAHRRGLHIGCACEGWDNLRRWFSRTETLKLGLLGYRLVDASACEVIARTPHQVIIGSRLPLAMLPRYQCGEVPA